MHVCIIFVSVFVFFAFAYSLFHLPVSDSSWDLFKATCVNVDREMCDQLIIHAFELADSTGSGNLSGNLVFNQSEFVTALLYHMTRSLFNLPLSGIFHPCIP